jgi:hypothetical protein
MEEVDSPAETQFITENVTELLRKIQHAFDLRQFKNHCNYSIFKLTHETLNSNSNKFQNLSLDARKN